MYAQIWPRKRLSDIGGLITSRIWTMWNHTVQPTLSNSDVMLFSDFFFSFLRTVQRNLADFHRHSRWLSSQQQSSLLKNFVKLSWVRESKVHFFFSLQAKMTQRLYVPTTFFQGLMTSFIRAWQTLVRLWWRPGHKRTSDCNTPRDVHVLHHTPGVFFFQ